MAVAFDAATTDGTADGVPQTARTFSHTCTGSNRLLLVTVGYDLDGSDVAVSSITYAGAAMTQRISVARGTSVKLALWYLAAPASGANNVVVTLASSQEFTAAATSFTGVHQTTPLGTAASANGSSTAPTVNVASAADELVLDAVVVQAAGTAVVFTIGGGQTQRWAKTASNATPLILVDGRGSTETGSATTTMSWTLNVSAGWTIAAVPIKPSASAGSGTVTFTGGGDFTLGAGLIGPDYDVQVAINF